MNKLVYAALAAVVVQLVASYAFYELLMASQFDVWEAEVARPEPLLLPGLAALLLIGLFLATLFPRLYEGGDPMMEGAKMGLLVGMFLAAMVILYYGVYELQLAGVVADIVFNVILLAVMGAVVGRIYGGAPEPAIG